MVPLITQFQPRPHVASQPAAGLPARWIRAPGDIVFSIGAALFAWFVLGLLTGHSCTGDKPRGTNEESSAALAGR